MTEKNKLVSAAQSTEPDLPANEPEQIRELRRLQGELESARSSLKVERAKFEQAEQDLRDARRRESILLATRDQVQTHTVPARKTRGKKSPATPVICCNDWHAEGRVDPVMVNGLNEFDLDTCRARLARLWEKVVYLIDFWRSVANVQDAVLWLGGDLISGSIHEELEESNELGPGEAVVFVVQQVADGIRYLFEHAGFKALHVVCNYGNHGRTVRRKRIATAHLHSYEWLAYNQLASYFRSDRRVSFQIANGYHAYCEIQGWKVRFHHGDAVRYYGGVGGISIPINKALAQWNKSSRADYDLFGHWHTFMDCYTWVSCGCLIGYDPFALSIKADFQRPTQTLVVFDREHGKVAALPIFVS